MLLLLLLRKFFTCTLGGAGAIRTGLARCCVTIVPRGERVLVVFVGVVATVDIVAIVLAAALSSSVIASCIARSNCEFSFRLLR